MIAHAADLTIATRHNWRMPILFYGAFTLIAIFALHPTALQMAAQWFQSSSYHHGIIVAPLSLWMIFQRPLPTPSTSALSLFGILAAIAWWLMGRASGIALIEQIAFVSLLIAGTGVIFGIAALRAWAFPLGFLYFMVPFGEALMPYLQTMTAGIVITMLHLIGMPAAIDGVLIKTQSGLFEIAEACAGLNFLLAALMIASLYAWLSLRGLVARVSFVAIAAIIALAANVIRAFFLIWLATISDMKIAVGADHMFIGLAFYGVIFALLFFIGEQMRKRARPITADAHAISHTPWRAIVAILALVPVLGAAIYANAIINRETAQQTPVAISPLSAPGWRMASAPENWSPSFQAADKVASTTYLKGDHAVFVSIAWFNRDRPGAEIINYNNRSFDGDFWRHIANIREVVYLFGHAEETDLEIIAGPERRRLVVASVYWRGDEIYTDVLKFKLAQLRDKLQGRNPPGGIIMIASAYQGTPDDALRRIRAFTSDIETFADWRARNHGDG